MTMILIEGPFDRLNDSYDDIFRGSGHRAWWAYECTKWLYEYAVDNAAEWGWQMWSGADDIMSAYEIQFEDDDTLDRERVAIGYDDITARGMAILEAAIKEGEREQSKVIHEMLIAWAREIHSSQYAAEAERNFYETIEGVHMVA